MALSPHENRIIAAILALAAELPRPLTEYTQALGEMRRNAFRVPGRSRGEVVKSCMDGHQIRATDSQWKGMK